MDRLSKIIQSRPILFTGLFFIFALSTVVFFETNRIRGYVTRPTPKPVNVVTNPIQQVEIKADPERKDPSKNYAGISYPITDGKTYMITSAVQYPCALDGEPHTQEGLQVKRNGKWREVYRIENRWNLECFPLISIIDESVKVSPLDDYVWFRIVGWEWSESKLVNTKTGKQLLPQDTHVTSLIWSKDARNYAFLSHFSSMGGTGKEAVWVSKYKDLDNPILILNLAEWADVTNEDLWKLYGIDGLKFVDNQTIQFSIFDRGKDGQNENEVARYQYNLEKEKLKEIFRK